MSRKILLTTTAIALAAGLTAAQAQSNSRDRSHERTQNSQSQDPQEQNERSNSQADRAQNTQSPQAAPSGSSAQRNGSRSNSNTAQSVSPRGSQTRDNASRSQKSSAQSASPNARSSAKSASTPDSSNGASATQPSGKAATSSSALVKLTDQQRSRVAASISAQKVEPVTNVNFSIAIGTRVPRSVHLHTVSADIVSSVPQYRGYSYFVTNNQIVIVEPRTYEIVSVMPYSGGGVAATVSSTKHTGGKFSSGQRQTIKKQIVARPARTTVTQTREITVGEEVPETIILEDMPASVYTEVPGARPYRYYRTDRDVVIVDPADRHIVDVLD
jgi:hypothetical protein